MRFCQAGEQGHRSKLCASRVRFDEAKVHARLRPSAAPGGIRTRRSAAVLLFIVTLTPLLVAPPSQGTARRAEPTDSAYEDQDRNRVFDNLDRRLEGQSDDTTIGTLVMLNVPATDDEIASLQQQIGAFTITSNADDAGVGHPWHLIQGFAATLTRAQVYQLANITDVMQVEYDAPTTSDTVVDYQSYQNQTGIRAVHDAVNGMGYTPTN
jgi:hypothetical protein